MNTETKQQARTRYNKTYLLKKQQGGIVQHCFLVPKVLIPMVHKYIKQQTALLNKDSQNKG
jgi:hypothetical protein